MDDSSSGDDFSLSEDGGIFGTKVDHMLATGG